MIMTSSDSEESQICPDQPEPAASGRGGVQPLYRYETEIGLPSGFAQRRGGDNDASLLKALRWMEESRPPRQNFWPALCLAFVCQCEQALGIVGRDSETDPFNAFPREQHRNGGEVVNTLNLLVDGHPVTLRPYFNHAANVIRVSMRRDHPSAAAHATQAWPAYRDLITLIYAMTPPARTRFTEYIWQHGVNEAQERAWATAADRVIRPFEKVLADFETRNQPPGGALFQGLVFGYFTADSPNLTLESHSVNTGSSRVDMPGDVAGFRGGEVELAVEVKDRPITVDTVADVLVDFLEDLVEAPNTTAVVVADTVDDASRTRLAKSNVIALSRDDLRARVITWDLPKQQEALRGAMYYLQRIQKNSKLARSLTDFLDREGISTGVLDHPVITADDSDKVDDISGSDN